LAGRRIVAAVLAAAAAFTGCGSGGGGPAPEPKPIAGLVPGAWTWVPFPDSACEDGSPTGVAVSQGAGPDLVLFLNGGGACWDYLTCLVLQTASGGPFGEAEFEVLRDTVLPGSIFDRTLAGNPYADATLVFVPYCTGDVHSGDRVVTYSGAAGARAYHHVGHRNLLAFLPRLAATWPAPRRLVVTGASAGGFGALLNYDTIRSRWPAAEGRLVDDSGPPLDGAAISPDLLAAWRASWGVDALLGPLCGTACRTSFAPALTETAARWPADRLALLSSLRDLVISSYFQLSSSEFEAALLDTAGEVIAPLENARWFFVPGNGHTMLGHPSDFTQGDQLLGWLAAQASGDPSWASRQPGETPP
jgi:hypothetical protein